MVFAIHGSISFYTSNLLKINGENNIMTNQARCWYTRIPVACPSLNRSHVTRDCGDLVVPRRATGKGRRCGSRTSEAREGRRDGRFCVIAKGGEKGKTRENAAESPLEARRAAAAPVASFLYVPSQRLWPKSTTQRGTSRTWDKVLEGGDLS